MNRKIGEIVYLALALGDDEGSRPEGTAVTITKIGPFSEGQNLSWRGRGFCLSEPADLIAEAAGPFGFALREEHIRSTPEATPPPAEGVP